MSHEPTDPDGWVDRHGDALYRFARARVRDQETAEEIVQETLLGALKARSRFDGRSTERTWLIGILKRKVVDHYRRRSRVMPAADISSSDEVVDALFDERGRWRQPPSKWNPDPGALLRRADFLRVLGQCIEDLPDRQARAFTLRILDEVPGPDVRNILGLTATNLGVLLHRARLRLRQCLEIRWLDPDDGDR